MRRRFFFGAGMATAAAAAIAPAIIRTPGLLMPIRVPQSLTAIQVGMVRAAVLEGMLSREQIQALDISKLAGGITTISGGRIMVATLNMDRMRTANTGVLSLSHKDWVFDPVEDVYRRRVAT